MLNPFEFDRVVLKRQVIIILKKFRRVLLIILKI